MQRHQAATSGAPTGPISNRPADTSPVAQLLSSLEEGIRDQFKLVNVLENRLHVVLVQVPVGAAEDNAKVNTEPVSVVERLERANHRLRVAQERVSEILGRLQV